LKRVAIFGDALDLHVITVEEAIMAQGGEVRIFSPSRLDAQASAFADLMPTGWRFVDGYMPDAMWIYRLPPPYISPGPRFETIGASHASVALVLDWEARGVFSVNSPRFGLGQNKPIQLATLHRAGVRVPESRICITEEQVAAAAEAFAPSIVKPLSQGWHTRAFDPNDIPPLPCLVQRRTHGQDIRVTVVGEDIVSAVVIPNGGEVDFRAAAGYSTSGPVYDEAHLKHDERQMALAAARACGLNFTGIDMKRPESGDSVVLEANPGPAFLDIENKMGHAVSRALARLLMQSPSHASET
jgi:RimK-like ATP-grasp domain